MQEVAGSQKTEVGAKAVSFHRNWKKACLHPTASPPIAADVVSYWSKMYV